MPKLPTNFHDQQRPHATLHLSTQGILRNSSSQQALHHCFASYDIMWCHMICVSVGAKQNLSGLWQSSVDVLPSPQMSYDHCSTHRGRARGQSSSGNTLCDVIWRHVMSLYLFSAHCPETPSVMPWRHHTSWLQTLANGTSLCFSICARILALNLRKWHFQLQMSCCRLCQKLLKW